MKGSSSEEEEIGIHKCRIRSRFYIINEEVKGWTFSSKQQEAPPEPTKTKDDIHLEQMKRTVKRAALEWDDFVIQWQFKPLMYVDCSLCEDRNKGTLIDELNFKNCIHLKRNTRGNFFVVITQKKVYYSSRIFWCQQYLFTSIYSKYQALKKWFRTCQYKWR